MIPYRLQKAIKQPYLWSRSGSQNVILRWNDLTLEYPSSFSFFFFFLAVLDLSFLVIVFDLQIEKNKTLLAENGNKIEDYLSLLILQ